ECDRVDTRCEHLVGELRRDADAVGEVLAVEDAEVDSQLVAERRQPLLEHTATGDAHGVCDEQDSQGSSVAAGRSSIATWLPASCVYFARACLSTPERSIRRPTFVLEAAIVEPTVRAGSGFRCVREPTD